MLTQRQRERYLPTLDRLLNRVGKYAAYELHSSEYVGTVQEVSVDTLADILTDYGYGYNGLSALKTHPDWPGHDAGSYRKIDAEKPRWQWHVHLFDTGWGTDIFSHYEYRPDLVPIADESIGQYLGRLREHYHPTWDIRVTDPEEATYFLGAYCPDVADFANAEYWRNPVGK